MSNAQRTSIIRRSIAPVIETLETRRLMSLSYITTADYDYMLRALALNDFRVRYRPRVFVDFQIGGISTRGLGVTMRGNLECLRSRREHLKAPPIDAAFFLRFARRILQIRPLTGG